MTTYNVSTVSAFQSALSQAKAGDSILLAPGTYAGLSISNVNIAGGAVTIGSQNNANPAVLSTFELQSSSGLSFSHLEFSTVGSSDPYFAFRVYDSQNISYDSILAQGTVGSSSTGPDAFLFQGCNGVSITNSSFNYLPDGLRVTQDSNVTLSGNSFQNLESDGIDASQVSSITISNNTFTNFDPLSGDHPDAIQFSTGDTTAPSQNITITGNTIVRGAGGAFQGIFLGNEIGMTYQNVTVTNNHILGGLGNGIAVGQGSNVLVSGNYVDGYPDQLSALSVQSSSGVQLNNNFAEGWNYLSTDTGLTQSGNQTLAAITATSPPLILNPGSTTPVSASGAATLVAPSLMVIDPESVTVASAQVSITGGFLAGDALNFANQNGITGSYNAATGVLTLTGTASQTAYQAALEAITFSSSASDPTHGGTDTARNIAFLVNDGLQSSRRLAASLAVVRPDAVGDRTMRAPELSH
jgi:hypothetical protein